MYATISVLCLLLCIANVYGPHKATAMMNCAVRPLAIKNFCKWSSKSVLINHILTLVTHNKPEHIIYDDDVLVLHEYQADVVFLMRLRQIFKFDIITFIKEWKETTQNKRVGISREPTKALTVLTNLCTERVN